MTNTTLSLSEVSWKTSRGLPILDKVSLELNAGRVLGVVGPNGAGKSTFLRLIYRFLRPTSGAVCLNGVNIWEMSARTVAQKIAAVLQEQPTDFALTVQEIVDLGRTPHRTRFGGSVKQHAQVVQQTIATLELESLSERKFGTLSGGERQRVMVARALAQEPDLLVLDEPTNHLDIRHQLEIIKLIQNLDMTIVTSLHDLNMAVTVCDDILLLERGQPVAFGPPSDVLADTMVSRTFGVQAQRHQLQKSDTSLFTYQLHT